MSNTIALLRLSAWASLWSGAGPKGWKAGTPSNNHAPCARETQDQVNWHAASGLRTLNAAHTKRCGGDAPSVSSDYMAEVFPFTTNKKTDYDSLVIFPREGEREMSAQARVRRGRAPGASPSGVAGIVQANLERSFCQMGESGYLLRPM
jgi:hypothetical protein